ncbi:MAG: class I SAM-dependent methyltransferase [Chloroflexota bacterium]
MSSHQDVMKQEVIAMFNRAAPTYGQVGTKQFTYFGNLLVERLAIPPGAAVLDVASGRGALLFPAAERVGVSGQVIGGDLAPAMVEQTAAEIERRGLSQATVEIMDAEALVFEPESFDFITCGFALHLFDFERALPNFRAFLKPNGLFAAIIPSRPGAEALAPWNWLFDLTRAVFPPGFVPPPSWNAPRRLNTPELAQAALTQAGFSQVWTEQHETTLYFRDEHDWWDWEWSQGSRFWLEGMSPEGLDRFQRESQQHLRAMQTPQGIPMVDAALFIFGRK